MTEDGTWRDEERLPLSELDRAMATYSADGQVDDATGGEAGPEEEFGEEFIEGVADEPDGRDPDPTSAEGRRLRPSPEGPHTGPA
jgi:hypothetical protein